MAGTTTAAKARRKVYKPTDTVLCKSITHGEMRYIGHKSGEIYIFADMDDTAEIEVRDLNYLRSSRSEYLYAPLFVIEDEEFMKQDRWKEIQDIYDKGLKQDVKDFLNLPLEQFRIELKNLPVGYRKALVSEAADQIEAGTFDSLNKIRAIDEICGTDLYCSLK